MKKIILLTLKQIEEELIRQVYEWDFGELCKVTSDWFGGEVHWEKDDQFSFVPDENYNGAFDKYIKDEDEEYTDYLVGDSRD